MYYLMRWMRVDLDPEVVGPKQSRIVLRNKESVDREKEAPREEALRLVREARVVRLRQVSRGAKFVRLRRREETRP